MTNKNSLPREDRKHLREFLSYNPFFREMERHMHKKGYCKQGYSDEHLCIEEIWLQAIADVLGYDLFYQENHLLPCILRDDDWYDYDTCYYIASVRSYIFQARYRGEEGVIDEEAARKVVEAEYLRLFSTGSLAEDPNTENDIVKIWGWHCMYGELIRDLHIYRQADFTRLIGFKNLSSY